MHYRWRYYCALVLIGGAVCCFCLVLNYFPPQPTPWLWFLVFLLGIGGLWSAHKKGLILLKSAPYDYGVYMVLLVFALLLMAGFIAHGPAFAHNWAPGMDDGWRDPFEQGEEPTGLNRYRPISWLRWLLGIVWHLFKTFFCLILTLILVMAVIPVVVLMFVMMWLADLKSGIVASLGLALGVAIILTLNTVGLHLAAPESRYLILGCVTLLGSLFFSVNWGALGVNGDVARLHPAFYEPITRLAEDETVTAAAVRERIESALPDDVQRLPMVDEIVAAEVRRLEDEGYLVPAADGGRYRVGIKKRLQLVHVLLAALALLWLANPSMGAFEIFPDNLPLIGNIDEFFAALLLLRLYPKWRDDRRESKGETRSPAEPSGRGGVPALGVSAAKGLPLRPA